MHPIDKIESLFLTQGAAQYGGEAVTQLEHALQCALQAAQHDAPDALVAAALLHDIGHLLHGYGEDAAGRGIDDRHERIGSNYLAQWFCEDTVAPVRLHVDAKRYLCHAEAAYRETLSAASRRSLERQGGAHDETGAAVFIAQPHAQAAVALRRWDDQAKIPARLTPALSHFLPQLERSLKSAAD